MSRRWLLGQQASQLSTFPVKFPDVPPDVHSSSDEDDGLVNTFAADWRQLGTNPQVPLSSTQKFVEGDTQKF